MSVEFRPFDRRHAAEMATFLADQDWPFHAQGRPAARDVLAAIETGTYDVDGTRTFLIHENELLVGVVRLLDLDDGTPLFDVRVAGSRRGCGIGTLAVGWLTGHLFTLLPTINRIEATTRHDNVAMRNVLRRCGYAKESHWRRAWPDPSGLLHDGVGYGILRHDWQTNTLTAVDWNDEEPPVAPAIER